MRVGELSELVDLPIPTIKYYLREGLIPSGDAMWSTRASYDDDHVRRLRLIRVLTEIGHLPLAHVRRVLAAVDDEELSLHDAFAIALDTSAAPPPLVSRAGRDARARALEKVDALVESLGWKTREGAAQRASLADALCALWRAGWDVDATVFAPLARAAEESAVREVEAIDGLAAGTEILTNLIVASLVFEQAFAALRGLVLERESARRFGRRRSRHRGGSGRPSRS